MEGEERRQRKRAEHRVRRDEIENVAEVAHLAHAPAACDRKAGQQHGKNEPPNQRRSDAGTNVDRRPKAAPARIYSATPLERNDAHQQRDDQHNEPQVGALQPGSVPGRERGEGKAANHQ